MILLRPYGQYTQHHGININVPSERPWLACELKIKTSVRARDPGFNQLTVAAELEAME